MQPGDLILDKTGEVGLILTEPWLCSDCEPGGDAYPNEEYYLIDVQFSTWIEPLATDEVEIISYAER